jgi:flagellar hook-basal body complex protein FliE
MATSIQAISNFASTASTAQANAMLPSAPAAEGGTPFSDLVKDAAGEVDSLQSQAQAAVTGLMTGTGVDVHTAMIATEKASMAFELSLAVRNKAVQAYQQVMSMQF